MTPKSGEEAIRRPNVSWFHGLIRLLLLAAGGFAASYLIKQILPEGIISAPVLTDFCIMILFLLTARSNALLAISLYQRYGPAHVRLRCAMAPTCSEYAMLAIRRYGVFKGCLMTYRRLVYRCDGTPVTDYP